MTFRQQEKHEVIHKHFRHHLGSHVPRSCLLNFDDLGWHPQELHHLELPFTEDEVKKAIMSMPKQKAPGPDGYIGSFFSLCWNIIKSDIMKVVDQFYAMNQQNLHFLNHALVVLIPKKKDPCYISDYGPISLINSFAKIISKVLANNLGPQLKHMISINQSAFIKKRCIHDNFIYVQQVVKIIRKKKTPTLFIKLDISKAFDTVNWSYLLYIIEHLGFGQRWRN
jgi:hypothetical protein